MCRRHSTHHRPERELEFCRLGSQALSGENLR
jgi:hypothetical protein